MNTQQLLLLILCVRHGETADCVAGFILNNGECEPCRNGFYFDEGRCHPCPPGRFSQAPSVLINSCSECPYGTFATQEASATCVPCPSHSITTITGASSLEDCYCNTGYRSSTNDSYTCVKCDHSEWCLPGGAVSSWSFSQQCNDSNPEVEKFGSKHSLCELVQNTAVFERRMACARSDQCPTQKQQREGDFGCRQGYYGVRCQSCITGFGKAFGNVPANKCYRCWVVWLLGFFKLMEMLALATLAVYGVAGRHSFEINERVLIIRAFAFHMQLIGLLRWGNVYWHDTMKGLVDYLTMGIPFGEMAACAAKNDGYISSTTTGLRGIVGFATIPLLFPLLGVVAIKAWNAWRPLKKTVPLLKIATGISLVLFVLSFVDLGVPLLRIISCVGLDGWDEMCLATDLNVVCGSVAHKGKRAFGLILGSAILFVFPAGLLFTLWWAADFGTNTIQWSAVLGFFFHGYRTGVRCWMIVLLIRQTIIAALFCLSDGFTPRNMVLTTDASGVVAIEHAPYSDVGSWERIIISGVLIGVVYVLGELFTVENGVGLNLCRLSFLAVATLWGAASVAKVDTAGTYSRYTATKQVISINTRVKQEQYVVGITYGASILAVILHFLFLAFCLYRFIVCTEEGAANFWIARKYLDLKNKINRVANFGNTSADQGGKTIQGSWFCAVEGQGIELQLPPVPTRVPPLQSLRRSKLISLVTKDDVARAVDCLGSTSPMVALAAMIRLGCHPYTAVRAEHEIWEELKTFPREALATPVSMWLDLREALLSRFESLSIRRLEAVWWAYRTLLLIRYPQLEDPSLELVPRHAAVQRRRKESPLLGEIEEKAKETRSEKLIRWFHKCLDFPTVLFLKILHGKLRRGVTGHADLASVVDYMSLDFAGVPDVKNRTQRKLFFRSEVAQRALCCLFLDISDYHYQMPREFVIRIFAVTGIAPGTRNDGKSDSLIRQYNEELRRRGDALLSSEQPEGLLALGKVVRARQEENRRVEKVTRQAQKKLREVLDFGAAATKAAKLAREFEAAVMLTREFFAVFPSAGECVESVSGNSVVLPKPDKMIRVLEDRIIVETPDTLLIRQTKNVVTAVNMIFDQLQKGWADEKPESETFLFRLTCVGGEFHVIPESVGIYVDGSVVCRAGPRGRQTALQVRRAAQTVKPEAKRLAIEDQQIDLGILGFEWGREGLPLAEEEDSLPVTPPQPETETWGSLTLDPVVELTRNEPDVILSDGSSDWTLSVYLLTDLTQQKEEVLCVVGTDTGDGLLAIERSTRKMGILLGGCFSPFAGEGVLLDALPLPQNEQWTQVVMTARPRYEDEGNLKSPIVTVLRLYYNGQPAGFIRRSGVFSAMATLGNLEPKARCPGPCWSELKVWDRLVEPSKPATQYQRHLQAPMEVQVTAKPSPVHLSREAVTTVTNLLESGKTPRREKSSRLSRREKKEARKQRKKESKAASTMKSAATSSASSVARTSTKEA